MVTNKELAAALVSLGGKCGTVASTLSNKGIVGNKGETDSCPVAMYLKEQFPGYEVEVSAMMVTIEGPYSGIDNTVAVLGTYEEVKATTPNSIADFIVNFDYGAYPELDVEGQVNADAD